MMTSLNKIVKVANIFFKKPNTLPTFLYFGPAENAQHFIPKMVYSNEKTWEIVTCETWHELNWFINNRALHALIIHYSVLVNKKTDINESIIDISPFIKIKKKHTLIRLALAIDQSTTCDLIKEAFGSSYIRNIVPSSTDFGLIEYTYSLNAVLHQTYYCPLKIITLLSQNMSNTNTYSNSVSILALTPRQTEIATLISKNHYSNKQIARILGISESSVKCHLMKIFKKHNISNRLQLSNSVLRQK